MREEEGRRELFDCHTAKYFYQSFCEIYNFGKFLLQSEMVYAIITKLSRGTPLYGMRA